MRDTRGKQKENGKIVFFMDMHMFFYFLFFFTYLFSRREGLLGFFWVHNIYTRVSEVCEVSKRVGGGIQGNK